MKNTILLRVFVILTAVFCLAFAASVQAQTQGEMNATAAQDFKKADVEMNRVYAKLMGKLDAAAQNKLKTAQRAWVAFRDAEAELHADLAARGGSMAPMEYEATRADLTIARTKELQQMMKDYAD